MPLALARAPPGQALKHYVRQGACSPDHGELHPRPLNELIEGAQFIEAMMEFVKVKLAARLDERLQSVQNRLR